MADRAVHRAPYQGVEGLIVWALSMWPVLNGKCLMSGVDLREMDCTAALDVMFFLFEEDVIGEPDTLKARSLLREQLWPQWFYGKYPYPRKSEDDNASTTTYGSQDMMDLPDDFGSEHDEKTIKPFVPASSPDELAMVLDGPMGGD